jgi:hypothetical protein
VRPVTLRADGGWGGLNAAGDALRWAKMYVCGPASAPPAATLDIKHEGFRVIACKDGATTAAPALEAAEVAWPVALPSCECSFCGTYAPRLACPEAFRRAASSEWD